MKTLARKTTRAEWGNAGQEHHEGVWPESRGEMNGGGFL